MDFILISRWIPHLAITPVNKEHKTSIKYNNSQYDAGVEFIVMPLTNQLELEIHWIQQKYEIKTVTIRNWIHLWNE